MSSKMFASVCAVAATLSVGCVVSGAANAADMPIKAPVIAPSVPLDVHGFADYTYASNRVTGGGLLLYPNNASLSQFVVGLSLDLYKDPAGFINSVSVFGSVWNEYWNNPTPNTRTWQEMDSDAGFSVGFAKSWKFTAEHVQFNFPTGIPTAYNYVFTLGYDDSGLKLLPIALNPYVSLFYNGAGGSTVVRGTTKGYRVTVGIAPSFAPIKTLPLTLTIPTAIVFGPSSFWNRADGTTNLCGTTGLAPCATSNLGMFNTGLQAKYALDAFVPKRLGSWYVKGGVQYYHIFNDALLSAQTATFSGTTAFANAKRDITVWSTGVGFSF